MTDQQKTPVSRRRQAEGKTGVWNRQDSVPTWARKRQKQTLLHHEGVYYSPEELGAHFRAESERSRGCRGGTPYAHPCEGLESSNGSNLGQISPISAIASPDDPLFRTEFARRLSPSLPCRSLETTQPKDGPKPPSKPPQSLSSPHKKVAAALTWNVAHFCKTFGVERVGFLTLTFADHVTDVKEASRRFNSLASHVLRARYGEYIRVLERQKSGRIHYHLLVSLPDDIRTGADFDAFTNRDYKTANNHLRREWAFWRKTASLYGFGRTELMPIRSNSDAMGQYVGKYIGKHIGQREERDKGARLVSYSGTAKIATCKFANVGKYENLWRAKVATFVRQMSAAYPHRRIRDMDDMSFHFGSNWSYKWRDYILNLPPSDLSVPF